jgi:hypothetical protein
VEGSFEGSVHGVTPYPSLELGLPGALLWPQFKTVGKPTRWGKRLCQRRAGRFAGVHSLQATSS